jgi:hypothetical protein
MFYIKLAIVVLSVVFHLLPVDLKQKTMSCGQFNAIQNHINELTATDDLLTRLAIDGLPQINSVD